MSADGPVPVPEHELTPDAAAIVRPAGQRYEPCAMASDGRARARARRRRTRPQRRASRGVCAATAPRGGVPGRDVRPGARTKCCQSCERCARYAHAVRLAPRTVDADGPEATHASRARRDGGKRAVGCERGGRGPRWRVLGLADRRAVDAPGTREASCRRWPVANATRRLDCAQRMPNDGECIGAYVDQI